MPDQNHNLKKHCDRLIYGRYYQLWRNNCYLGVGMFVNNPNFGDANGDAFAKEVCFFNEVWINVYYPDEWKLIF